MTVAASAPLAHGTRLGRYVIDDALGSGAKATVYRARDVETDGPVAIKRASAPGDDGRWEIEARLLAELSHPGLASLVDHFEEPPGIYNIVMRLVDGIDLARLLWDQGTPGLPVRDVLRWLGQVCEALQYLHDQQVVHGDVKPRNVVRGPDRVVVVDLGVAIRLGRGGESAQGGTPRFMAPEVFAGDAVSPRSDVFSIAASAWNMITGTPPAYGEDRDARRDPRRHAGARASTPRRIGIQARGSDRVSRRPVGRDRRPRRRRAGRFARGEPRTSRAQAPAA